MSYQRPDGLKQGPVIDPGLFKQLKKLSKDSGISMRDIVEEGLKVVLAKYGSAG